eukprot:3532270-Pyramimonas_sp.AAC.1
MSKECDLCRVTQGTPDPIYPDRTRWHRIEVLNAHSPLRKMMAMGSTWEGWGCEDEDREGEEEWDR